MKYYQIFEDSRRGLMKYYQIFEDSRRDIMKYYQIFEDSRPGFMKYNFRNILDVEEVKMLVSLETTLRYRVSLTVIT